MVRQIATTNMRGSFSEDMLRHSTSVILRDDMLEVFVGQGCGSTKDGIGNGLGKCSVNDDLILT